MAFIATPPFGSGKGDTIVALIVHPASSPVLNNFHSAEIASL
jgi:hypothetical protein